MSYSIIVTPTFERDAKQLLKKYKSLSNDLAILFETLEKEPTQGAPLGNNCYKIRLLIKSKSRGKSGGARVITCVKITSNRIYLLSIYDKTEKENITDKELKQLLKFI